MTNPHCQHTDNTNILFADKNCPYTFYTKGCPQLISIQFDLKSIKEMLAFDNNFSDFPDKA